jgi:hypothetical protein
MQNWLNREISKIKIKGTAHLFLDACGMVCVRGIDTPQEFYEADLSIDQGIWTLSFSSPDAPKGALRWATPDSLTFFRADASPEAKSGDATLYAELSMDIDITGSGAFDVSLEPAELIFTGESNACIDASRLRHWHLRVRTEDVRFHFFGDLALTPQ